MPGMGRPPMMNNYNSYGNYGNNNYGNYGMPHMMQQPQPPMYGNPGRGAMGPRGRGQSAGRMVSPSPTCVIILIIMNFLLQSVFMMRSSCSRLVCMLNLTECAAVRSLLWCFKNLCTNLGLANCHSESLQIAIRKHCKESSR